MKEFKKIYFTMVVGLILFLGGGICDVLASDATTAIVATLRVISLVGIAIMCVSIFAMSLKMTKVAKKDTNPKTRWLYQFHLVVIQPFLLAFSVCFVLVYWLDIGWQVEGYMPGPLESFFWNLFDAVRSWVFIALFSIGELIGIFLLFFGKRAIPAIPVE